MSCRSRPELSDEYIVMKSSSIQPRTGLAKYARSPCADIEGRCLRDQPRHLEAGAPRRRSSRSAPARVVCVLLWGVANPPVGGEGARSVEDSGKRNSRVQEI